MAWTAPMSAVDGTVFTAAQWNTHIRDNLLETEAGRAQTVSGYSVVSDYTQLIERNAQVRTVTTLDTTSNTSYDDLDTTDGPQITIITGTRCLVGLYGSVRSTGGTAAWMSYEVSGASSFSPSDNSAIEFQVTDPDNWAGGVVIGLSGLTAGTNIFTAKYRVSSSGQAKFDQRRIWIIPF